jgi:hypothetical protein
MRIKCVLLPLYNNDRKPILWPFQEFVGSKNVPFEDNRGESEAEPMLIEGAHARRMQSLIR